MKTEEEIRTELTRHTDWLDEWEGKGAAEEGPEVGWVEALAWVLGDAR